LPSDLVIILSIVLAVIIILIVYMKKQGELKEDEYTLWEEENIEKEVEKEGFGSQTVSRRLVRVTNYRVIEYDLGLCIFNIVYRPGPKFPSLNTLDYKAVREVAVEQEDPPCLRVDCVENNQESTLKYYFLNAEKLARHFE